MRHRKAFRKLSRTSAHRARMLQSLVNGVFVHGRIITTVTRAKEARRLAEKMITLGKRGEKDLHARRQAYAFLQDNNTVRKLFSDIAPRFTTRPGGYTRIVRLGGCRWDGDGKGRYAMNRLGDNGPRAVFELVERKEKDEEMYLAGVGSRARDEAEAQRKSKHDARKTAAKGEKGKKK